jgi:hypothetical protein
LVVLLAFVAGEVAKKWLPEGFGVLWRGLVAGLAGNWFLQRRAIRDYRKILNRKHSRIVLPFLDDLALDMKDIYLPLRTEERRLGGATVDSDTVLSTNERVVIIGPPGAGKSVLLRNRAFRWARRYRRHERREAMPIIVDLHRLSADRKPIADHLVDQIKGARFYLPSAFLAHSLTNGRVQLLFDGLDEVATNDRSRVVTAVKDFMAQNSKCPVIITSRAPVYEGQFAEDVDRTLSMVGFDDYLIHRFLMRWPAMSTGDMADRLMATLRDSPRIVRLARNPLILTMIAYLYVKDYWKTGRTLPHTRATLYKRVTDTLLTEKHHPNSPYPMRYGPVPKQGVLRLLALSAQDATSSGERDGIVIEDSQVWGEVSKIMEKAGLSYGDAQGLVQEVIDRSGLLSKDEDGDIQFSHPTFKEFFAARALLDDAEGLLTRFKNDPDGWRETVKLWCGLRSRDAPNFFRGLHAEDPVLAFECLADVNDVDTAVAKHIIEAAQQRLRIGPATDELLGAFAAVASDPRERGREVFTFLGTLLSTGDQLQRRAAGIALARTNLPRAAELLASHYPLVYARGALVDMADVAIPQLAAAAGQGVVEAFDDLSDIRTAGAAGALVRMLWGKANVAREAAWRLAELIGDSIIARFLVDLTVSQEWRAASSLPWIWAPFEKGRGQVPGSLGVIVSRIAFLIDTAPSRLLPAQRPAIDPRIAVPLVAVNPRDPTYIPLAIKATNVLRHTVHEALVIESRSRSTTNTSIARTTNTSIAGVTEASELSASLLAGVLRAEVVDDHLRNDIADEVIACLGWSAPKRYLVSCLPRSARTRLLAGLLAAPVGRPNQGDWKSIFDVPPYEFNRGIHYRFILAVTAVLVGIALTQGTHLLRAGLPGWESVLVLVAMVLVAGGASILVITGVLYESLMFGQFAFPARLIVTIATRRSVLREPLAMLTAGFAPRMVLLVSMFIVAFVPAAALLLFWTVAGGVYGTLWFLGALEMRKAANPLAGIITRDTTSTTTRALRT